MSEIKLEPDEKLICEASASHSSRFKTYLAGLALVISGAWYLVVMAGATNRVSQDWGVWTVSLATGVVIVYLVMIIVRLNRTKLWVSSKRLFFRKGLLSSVQEIRLYQLTHIAAITNRCGKQGKLALQYSEYGNKYYSLDQLESSREIARLIRFYRNRARDFGEEFDFVEAV